MSTSARFPAADVTTAAIAVQNRLQTQFDGLDGPRITNTNALYRSKALARFAAAAAAATPGGLVDLTVDDFDLIGLDLPQSKDTPAA